MSIRLDHISKRFGGFSALENISIEARPGEFLALLGPSGSGKTTLLRIMAGLEFPDAGSVHFEEQDVTGLKVAERHIGFVFQQYALFKHMTVADNIAFGLSVKSRKLRPSKSAIRARVQELLDLVQLSALGERYPAQLSGGQRQRVALARALAVDPALLLLDEPFGALDAKVRKDLRLWLRGLHDRMGLTSIFVTHDQEEALELADRVVVMDHGVIEQIATPEEVYNEPASAFVFDFVGESNCVPVSVANGAIHFLDQRLDAPVVPSGDGPAKLFFRPHDVVRAKDKDGSLQIMVAQTRQRGGSLRVEGKLTGLDTLIEIDMPLEYPPEPGTCIAVRPTRARLFDA